MDWSSRKGNTNLKVKNSKTQPTPAGPDTNMEELKIAFSYFDRNCDGSIEADELGAVMKALGYKVTHDELIEMIKLADLDGNNKVEFDEFVNVMNRHEWEKARLTRPQQEDDILRAAFKVFDRGNNGYISRCDLRRAMNELGENLTETELDLMMREADKDGNGKIDFEEFKLMQQVHCNMRSSKKH